MPATVAGRPPQEPRGDRPPSSPTSHPNTVPESASTAYRKRPSAERASSRSPARPSTVSAAVASSRVSAPSPPMAYRDTAPSAKFVVNAYRPSGVTTAQQISLRPLPTEAVTGAMSAPETEYDDAAAAPFWARN